MIIYSKSGQNRYKRNSSLPDNQWKWTALTITVFVITGMLVIALLSQTSWIAYKH